MFAAPLLRAARGHVRSVTLFFGVSLVCGGIDALIGLCALNMLGWSLTASTVAGFAVGFVCGYLAHELWTFSTGRLVVPANLLRYALSNLVLLGIRLGIVQALALCLVWLGIAQHALAKSGAYLAMLGLSFVVNYILCRFFVFKKPSV